MDSTHSPGSRAYAGAVGEVVINTSHDAETLVRAMTLPGG